MRITWVFVSFLLISCGAKDLSRTDAEQMIASSDNIVQLATNVPITQGANNDARVQGLLDKSGFSPLMADEITQFKPNEIIVIRPVDISIEVTGIQEGESRVADFQWSYVDLPKYVRRFAVAGGTGTARFSKYDDGWRVSDVSIKVGDNSYSLTASDMADIENDRLRVAEIEQARFDYVIKSWTPSKMVERITFAEYGRKVPQRVEISDVDVKFLNKTGGYSQVWFGHIMELKPNSNYGYNIEFVTKYRGGVSLQTYTIDNTNKIYKSIDAALKRWQNKYSNISEEERIRYNSYHRL
jgi:hypothetical protein